MSKRVKRTFVDKSSVKLSVIVSIALSNLLHKKLRSGLTVFGIAIGIGAIFFLLSFGIGLQRLVTTEVIGNQSIKTIDVVARNSKIISLNDITTNRISNIPNTESVGRSYFYPGSFKLSNSESDTIVYGIDENYENLTYLNIIAGDSLHKNTSKNSILLNKAALESVGISQDVGQVVGKSLEIIIPISKDSETEDEIRQQFTVVGVMDSGSGAEVFINSDIFREAGVESYSQIKVGANNVDNVSQIRAQIESLGFETTSPADTLDEINRVFRFMNFILVGFGAIGMVVAVLGMFNTLTISLLERTKEIGLMVALGARSIDMKRLFIIEALLLSMLGSIIGIVGAFLHGRIVNIIMNVFASRRGVSDGFELFAYPPLLIIGMILFMAVVGLLVVFLPARRAQKINPIDALRRE
jgi:putative ABC transport system permease protein